MSSARPHDFRVCSARPHDFQILSREPYVSSWFVEGVVKPRGEAVFICFHALLCESMLTPGVGLGDVPLGSCSYMTFRFSLLKQLGKMRVLYFFMRPHVLFSSHQHPRNLRYSIVLNRFTLSDCRSISKGKQFPHLPYFYIVWKMWTLEQSIVSIAFLGRWRCTSL